MTEDSSGTLIALDEQTVPADSDFVLEWRPRVGDAPNAALFSDVFQGDTYALLMLMPPSDPDSAVERLPRETIFVIDTSGSMDGTSIRQAKEALRLALRRLAPEDSFNLIQFNSTAVPYARLQSTCHTEKYHSSRSLRKELRCRRRYRNVRCPCICTWRNT